MEIYLVWYAPRYSDAPWGIMEAFTNLASAEAYAEKYKYSMSLHIEKIFAKTEFGG